jgi:hypothetical protein
MCNNGRGNAATNESWTKVMSSFGVQQPLTNSERNSSAEGSEVASTYVELHEVQSCSRPLMHSPQSLPR